jgi:hypothetical protein
LNGGYLDAHIFKDKGPANEYCQGHLINHGPNPNVMKIDFFWTNVVQSVGTDKEKQLLWSKISQINPIAEGPWYVDSSSLEIVYHFHNISRFVYDITIITPNILKVSFIIVL